MCSNSTICVLGATLLPMGVNNNCWADVYTHVPVDRKALSLPMRAVKCAICNQSYHLHCANLLRLPRWASAWACEGCLLAAEWMDPTGSRTIRN